MPRFPRKTVLVKLATFLVCAAMLLQLVLWRQAQHDAVERQLPYTSLTRQIPRNISSTEASKTNVTRKEFRVVRYKMAPAELQSLDSKPIHQLSIAEPYRSRNEGINRRCRRLSVNDSEVELSQMVYDDKHQFVMCTVPKGASTTWRFIAWYLLGKVKTQEELKKVNVGDVILNRGNMPVLGSLSRSEAVRRLQTYTTFVVMRHPLSRLVSAYNSKLSPDNPENVYKMRFGKPIAIAQASAYMHGIVVSKETLSEAHTAVDYLKHFEWAKKLSYKNSCVLRNFSSFDVKNDPKFQELTQIQQTEVLEYIKTIKSGEIPFKQFARYVANYRGDVNTMDVHWRPQTSICNPCAVNYDYVIKFENLNDDSERILEYLQRDDEPPESHIRMKPRKSLINSDKTMEYLETVDTDTRLGLNRFYKRDFVVYGYD